MQISVQKIAVTSLKAGNELRLPMQGTSMWPWFRNGDIALVRHCSWNDLEIGDLIVFMQNKKLITHRLIEIKENQLITKGDSLYNIDFPVDLDHFVGKVIEVKRRDKPVFYLQKSGFSKFLAQISFYTLFFYKIIRKIGII